MRPRAPALLLFVTLLAAAPVALAASEDSPAPGPAGAGGVAPKVAPAKGTAAPQNPEDICKALEQEPPDAVLEQVYLMVCKQTKPAVVAKTNRALIAPRKLRSPDAEYTTNHSVPAAVGELMSILVEVAVKKAKVSGLEVVRVKTRDAVCGLKNPWKTETKLFPATCQLLSEVSLERLASAPDAVYTALMDDILGGVAAAPVSELQAAATSTLPVEKTSALSDQAPKQANEKVVKDLTDKPGRDLKVAKSLVEATLSMARTALVRTPVAFAPSDAWALLGTALETVEIEYASRAVDDNAARVASSAAVAALRACVALLDAGATTCDPALLVKAAIASLGTTKGYDLSRIVAIVSQGIKVLAGGAEGNASVAARMRFRDAAEVVFAIVEPLVSKGSHLDLVRGLVLAALDGNVATIVSAAAELVTVKLTNEEDVAALHKVNLVVTAVGAYAETFSKPLGAPLTTEDREKLRETRKEILENLVEAASVRTNRHRDWVWSLGMPVGFFGGLQWVRQASVPATGPETSLSGSQWMAPQLELPLGIALQWLPSKACPFGLHFMALGLDLGQFAAYDREGEIAEADWETILSPGAQLGVTIGTPSNTFVAGFEMRYAPGLFAGNSESATTVLAGGALRFGVFLSYFVPFFDFN